MTAKLHYACFNCRKSFSRESEWAVDTVVCPNCGGTAYMMGRWFKPPRRGAIKQWIGLEKLSVGGYRLRHSALNRADEFLDEQEKRDLQHDAQRRFLLNLEDRPQQDRTPAAWKQPKKRKPVKR